MSFILYQRADPRYEGWLQLKSQQLRLRNLVQLIGVNLGIPENSELFFTLHVTPLSAPFFTSERIPKKAGQRVYIWKEIEPKHAYASNTDVKFSAKGCTIRIWSKIIGGNGNERCHPVLTWGVYFEGLYRLGSQNDWSSDMFEDNVILFRTPFGVFTAESCIKPRPTSLTKYLVISKTVADCKSSYKCKLLASLHRRQRAIIDEVELAKQLKSECETLAFTDSGSNSVPANQRRVFLSSRGKKIRPGSKKVQFALKKQIEEVRYKVLTLLEEKGRAEGRLQRIKKEKLGVDEMNKELVDKIEFLNSERRNLQQFKITLVDKRQRLSQLRSDVFLRKKQLVAELSVIYPLTLIDCVKRYSINGVQLLDPDLLDYEGGGQSSVALGYTAHLVSMLYFFLGVPLRYPIRHFGSRSRILDHIGANIQERDREFPLYFKGKQDVFCQYGRYLLDKNIAQIRWYCGLITQDLRSTLPNLAALIHNRLAIKGLDQNYDDDSLEVAQEITEESDSILCRSENSISLDKGLDGLGLQDEKIQNNLSTSLASIEFATNNSAALGDVYRGRSSEKFLSGWKKGGLAQPEVIDPSWLVSSMDADSDCGRRLSTCTGKSQQSDFESSLVSNSSEQSKSRRRRFGQVSLPEQFPDDADSINESSLNPPTTIKSTSESISGDHILDDPVQAKQLRLLDRKISMYFGERTTASSGSLRGARRTRSFDKLTYVVGDSSLFHGTQVEKDKVGQGENYGPGQTMLDDGATLSVAGIGDGEERYFSSFTMNSEASDIDTDNCDFHVSPPVETPVAPTKECLQTDPKLQTPNETSECVEATNASSVTLVKSTSSKLLMPNGSSVGGSELKPHQQDHTTDKPVNNDPDTPSDKEEDIEHPELESLHNLLDDKDAITSSSERGLDDESLWNRTEALMSSFQSFNLIRKSTIDPK